MSTAVQRTRVATAPAIVPQPSRRTSARRPPLEVVAPRARRVRRRSLAPVLSAVVVSLSLLVVVLGHAELVQGQVRLTNVQAQITAAKLLHQREGLALANLENPSRILRVAEGTLHMAPPDQVRQLAHVPLTTVLPAPHVSPSAASPPSQPATPGG